MLIKISPASLRQSRGYEYAVRFTLGGAATVFTGLIGAKFGPAVSGLFLALPTVFCASATLIERHQRHEKHKAGLSGRRRGQEAAALEAAGAGLGSLGLIAFAAVFYLIVERNIVAAFAGAVAIWALVSVAVWWLRRRLRTTRVQD